MKNKKTPQSSSNSLNNHLYSKKSILLIIATLISLALFLFISNMFLKNYVIGKILSELVLIESDGKYSLEINDVDYDLITSDLKLHEFNFQPILDDSDSAGSTFHFGIFANVIEFDGFNFFELVYAQKIDFRKIFLEKPEIILKGDLPKNRSNIDTSSNSGLSDILMKILQKGMVREFVIEMGEYHMMEMEHPNTEILGIGEFDIKIQDFEIEHLFNASINDLFFKTFELKIRDCHFFDTNSSHSIQFDNVYINSDEDSFMLSGLKISDAKTDSKEHLRIHVPEIEFKGIILDSILHNNEFLSSSVIIRDPCIMIDKINSQKEDSVRSNNSNTGRILPFIIRVDSLDIENANGIFNTVSDSIHFADLNVNVKNIRLDSIKDVLELSDNCIGNVELNARAVFISTHNSEDLIEIPYLYINENTGEFIIDGLEFHKENILDGRVVTVFNLSIPSVFLLDSNLRLKLKQQQIEFNTVRIVKPQIKLSKYYHNNSYELKTKHFFPASLTSVKWGEIQINNGELDFIKYNENNVIETNLHTLYSINSTKGIISHGVDNSTKDNINAQLFDFALSDFSFYHTDNSIDLRFDSLDMNVENQQLDLFDLSLSLEDKSYNTTDIQISELKISDFKPMEFVEGEISNIGDISVFNPEVKHVISKNKNKPQKRSNPLGFSFSDILFEGVNVYNGKFNLFHADKKDQPLVKGFLDKIIISEFSLDEVLSEKISGELLSKIALNASNIKTALISDYNLGVNKMSLLFNDLSLSGVEFVSDTLKANKTHELTMTVPEILFKINYEQDNLKDSLLMDFVRITDPLVRIDNVRKSINKQKVEKHTSKGAYIINMSDFVIDTIDFQYTSENNSDNINLNSFLRLAAFDLRIDLKDPLNSTLASYVSNKNSLELIQGKFNSQHIDLSYNNLLLSVLNQKFKLRADSVNFILVNKEHPPDRIYMPVFEMSGIDLHSLLNNKILSIDELEFRQAFVELSFHKTNNRNKGSLNQNQALHIKGVDSICIEKFKIYKAGVELISFKDSTKFINKLNDIDFTLNSLKINTQDSIIISESLKFADFNLFVPGSSFVLSDSLYTLGFNKLNVSYSQDNIKIDSLVLSPNFEKKAFFDRIGHQSDRMNISIHKVLCQGINYPELFKGNINIQNIALESFVLHGFRDKSYPFPENQRRKMPVAMLRKVNFPLNISSFSISKGYIAYAEHIEGSLYPGEVFLSDFNCLISNISNAKFTEFKNYENMSVSLSTYLMGQGYLNANIDFPLYYEQDTFHLKANLDEMELTRFSDMTKNLFGVEIIKGTGSAENLLINGNNFYSSGSMYMPYKKLKISLYNRHKGKKRGVGSSILSFLANELIIKSNNPKTFGKQRMGEIFTNRDQRKSYFNFIWKSTLSGIETTLGFENKQIRKHNRELIIKN